MLYDKFTFTAPEGRPFFYANAVATLDGKVAVGKTPKEYWPIGSPFDHAVLINLRSHADVLLHGKHTAREFRTVDSLAHEKFQRMRKRRSKNPELPYGIISNHPDRSLLTALLNNRGPKPLLITSHQAVMAHEVDELCSVKQLGEERVDLNAVAAFLFAQGYRTVLVEGGPTLIAGFLAHNLLDEIFLTLSPKIFGSDATTRTMVEGILFPPHQIKNCTLLSSVTVGNEIFLRYRVQ